MIPIYKIKIVEEAPVSLSNVKCDWSSQNWIVYTSNNQEKSFGNADNVCIFHPDQPSDIYEVDTKHNCSIDHIHWINGHSKFITIDESGFCKVWHSPDNFINSWQCFREFSLTDGDKVVKLVVVNNEHMFNWDVEKTQQKDLFKKFQARTPSCLTIEDGSVGLVVLSITGVLSVVIFGELQSSHLVEKTKLISYKSHVITADMMFNSAGKLFVVAQTDPAVVELFTVFCKQDSVTIQFSVEIWPCLVPHIQSDVFEIKAVKCVSVNFIDKVLVNVHHQHTSTIQLFEVKKEQVKLHPYFPSQIQQSQSIADACVCLQNTSFHQLKTIHALIPSNYINIGRVNDLAFTPMFLLVDSNTLQLYSVFDWTKPMQSSQLLENNLEIVSAVLSPCNHGIFVVTKDGMGILYTYSQFSLNHEKLKAKNIVTLLQYSLVESYIPWALVLSISTFEKHLVDQYIAQLNEEFQEYSPVVKQMFWLSFHQLLNLLRKGKKDCCAVLESSYGLILTNIFNFVVYQLPSNKEADFLEAVDKVCSSSKEMEIVKVVQLFDLKDFTLNFLTEPIHRPLIQWVMDYALHLARLIVSRIQCGQNLNTVLPHLESLVMLCLRKLLVIFYVMYQKNPQLSHIHAIFITMANSTDIVAQSFKLASKLQQLCDGDSNIEIAMSDLAFTSLPMMYLEIPSADTNSVVLSSAPSSSHQTLHTVKEYVRDGKQNWEITHQKLLQNPLSVGIWTVASGLRQIFDSINMTPSSLMQGEVLKQCCSCGCTSVHLSHSTRLVNVQWKDIWQKFCFCGGKWKQVSWN